MKKLIIILSIAAFTMSSKSEAQGLFYTSYGTQHLWGMPPEVHWVLERNYGNFHMVHTQRFWDRGRLYFDVVLQGNGVFVDVRVDRRGYIFNSVYRNRYPFYNHVCSSFCGFHRDYYMSYRVFAGHPYYYSYNHIYYRPNVVIVQQNPGHQHVHYKTHKQYRPATTQSSYRVDRSDNGRIDRINGRGSRDYRPAPRTDGRGNVGNGNNGNGNSGHHGDYNRGNNGVRDHGVGVGRGSGQGKGQGNGPGNVGNKGNNGVRDHGVGEGRGSGQGKGQGYGNGNGNSSRVYRSSAPRTSSSPRVTTTSSSSRTTVSHSSGRTSRSNSSDSGRTSSGRSTRTR